MAEYCFLILTFFNSSAKRVKHLEGEVEMAADLEVSIRKRLKILCQLDSSKGMNR